MPPFLHRVCDPVRDPLRCETVSCRAGRDSGEGDQWPRLCPVPSRASDSGSPQGDVHRKMLLRSMVKNKCMKWLTNYEITCNHKFIWQYFLSGEIYAWNSSPHWLSIPAFSPFIQRYKIGWNHLMGQSYDTTWVIDILSYRYPDGYFSWGWIMMNHYPPVDVCQLLFDPSSAYAHMMTIETIPNRA